MTNNNYSDGVASLFLLYAKQPGRACFRLCPPLVWVIKAGLSVPAEAGALYQIPSYRCAFIEQRYAA